MKYQCPSCKYVFDASADDAAEGLCCPACSVGFVPVVPEATPEQRLERRRREIRGIANGIVKLAAILFIIGVLVAFITVFSESPSTAGYISAGVLVSISFWVYFLGQIVHIRANTEK